MCDNKSHVYNKWHNDVHGGEDREEFFLEEWHRNALSLAPELGGLKILEVGCGVGDFAIYLSSLNADVIAVDFSETAIKMAKQKAEYHRSDVEFQVADAELLPFSDESFDLIFSCECIEHLNSPQNALSEFYRVLKTSGKLIITTENYSNAMLLAWIVSWLRSQPFNSGAGVQPIEHFFLFWRVRTMISSCGFSVLRMVGSHHVFLLLPRFDPSTFVKKEFNNPFLASVFRPLARHVTFEAIKA